MEARLVLASVPEAVLGEHPPGMPAGGDLQPLVGLQLVAVPLCALFVDQAGDRLADLGKPDVMRMGPGVRTGGRGRGDSRPEAEGQPDAGGRRGEREQRPRRPPRRPRTNPGHPRAGYRRPPSGRRSAGEPGFEPGFTVLETALIATRSLPRGGRLSLDADERTRTSTGQKAHQDLNLARIPDSATSARANTCDERIAARNPGRF